MNTSVQKTTVSIIGLGYIGLPTAIIAAHSGMEVFGYDINEELLENIKLANIPGLDSDLIDSLKKEQKQDNLCVKNKLYSSDYFVICVPTPLVEGKAGLSAIWHAAETIGLHLKKGDTVILESTVPVGTTKELAKKLAAMSGLIAGTDFFVAYCPERVIPGKIFEELVRNNRVIGGINEASSHKAVTFYRTFVQGEMTIVDAQTAEMVKLVENSFRDCQVAFANQVSEICQSAGVSPYKVIELANKHPRVNILNPGVGVGGHCVAVDPQFLINGFEQSSSLLASVRSYNRQRPGKIAEQVLGYAQMFKDRHGRIPTIGALGLSYKPNVGDIRESPALEVVKALKQRGDLCIVKVADPFVQQKEVSDHGRLILEEAISVVHSADIVAILVAHQQFYMIDSALFKAKLIIDPSGVLCKKNAQGKSIEKVTSVSSASL